MERVTGFGGFFFRAADPASLAAWYESHLGIRRTAADYADGSWWQETGPTVFEPFAAGPEELSPRPWVINLRVSDLDAMVAQLSSAGIEVTVDPTTYPNGRFARLVDPEDNPIELWEPGGTDLVRPMGW